MVSVPPSAFAPFANRFKAGDQELVDDLEAVVSHGNEDRTTRRALGEKLGMWDIQLTPIGHVDAERLERTSLMHASELVDGHFDTPAIAQPHLD
jgi:hypothetical protein